ncbi:hypothetical protein V5799_027929 [Amblyomma americanum]|uniref:DUF4806 domain-containing protein n=1 Tax=Amblyomma americanum TaxID=6943 RepID=A0AAQ4DEB5_AMBAM
MGGVYVVVKFPQEDNDVAVVHKNWLSGDSCMWPPKRKEIRSLIKGAATPALDWKKVPCIVVQAFDTYGEAQKGLRKAEDTSDLLSDYDLGRGKRRRLIRQLSSSEDENVSPPPPQPPQSMLQKAIQRKESSSRKSKEATVLSYPSGFAAHDAGRNEMPGAWNQPSGRRVLHSQNLGDSDDFFSNEPPPESAGGDMLNCRYTRSTQSYGQFTPNGGEQWQRSQNLQPENAWPARMAHSQPETLRPWPAHRQRNDSRFPTFGSESPPLTHGRTEAHTSWSDGGSTPRSTASAAVRALKPAEFEQIMKLLHTIDMRVEQQGRQLDVISRRLSSGFTYAVRSEVVTRPFNEVSAFEEFDSQLGMNEGLKTRLLQQLCGLGGVAAPPATRNVLEALMTPKVAVNYSWLGQKGKKKFCSLNVADVILRAVKQNFSESTQCDVINVVKVWLRHSAEKLKKEEAKAAKVLHIGTTEDSHSSEEQ